MGELTAVLHAALPRPLIRLSPLLIVAALWQTASMIVGPDDGFVPGLAAIGIAAVDLVTGGEIQDNLFITLFRAFFGLAIAIPAGVAIGTGMARSPTFNAYVYPLVAATYSLPKAALIPLLILWTGIGTLTNCVIVFLSCLLPIVVHTQQGVASTPRVAVWSAQSLGAGPRRVLWTVRLPHALPAVFTGLRIALGFSFVLTVSSEMVASTNGLGKLIFMYGENGSYNYMFAAVLFIVIVAFVADRALIALGAWCLHWDRQI
jgi:ABC-type nitrate/sulfonate/bicarbonate transport system permease component